MYTIRGYRPYGRLFHSVTYGGTDILDYARKLSSKFTCVSVWRIDPLEGPLSEGWHYHNVDHEGYSGQGKWSYT